MTAVMYNTTVIMTAIKSNTAVIMNETGRVIFKIFQAEFLELLNPTILKGPFKVCVL